MFEDEPSSPPRPPPPAEASTAGRRKNALLGLLGAVVTALLVVVVLAIDLLVFRGVPPRSELVSLEVDLRGRVPVARAEIVFRYGSKLSEVEPVGATCQLESGEISFDVVKQKQKTAARRDDDSYYAVTATCPDGDAESHADTAWEILTARIGGGTSPLGDLLAAGTCEVEVEVRLGHVVPFRSSVELPLPELLAMGGEEEKSASSSSCGDDETETKKTAAASSAKICRVDQQTLDVCLPLRLPTNACGLPSELRIKTPALEAYARPTYTEGMTLSVDAWEGTFRPGDDDDDDGSNSNNENDENNENAPAVVSLSSRDDRLPFYRPVLDLFLAPAEDSSAIALTVDGNRSFPELVLGRHHEFGLERFSRNASDLREDRRRMRTRTQTRKLEPSSSDPNDYDSPPPPPPSVVDTYAEGYDAAAADCIGVGEVAAGGDAFGFGLCWLLDVPGRKVAVVGNVTLFDRNLLAVSEVSWTTTGDTIVRIDLEAEALLVGEAELVDLRGAVLLEEIDESNIRFDVGVESKGGFWPFLANLETTWSFNSDEYDLKIGIDDFTLSGFWNDDDGDDGDGDEGIDGAVGAVEFRGVWTEDFSMDFRVDHGASDSLAASVQTSAESEPREKKKKKKRRRKLNTIPSVVAVGGASPPKNMEPIAGYEPLSRVTDHNALDLDQEAMEQQLSLASEDAYLRALRIYIEGGYSESVAEVALTNPLPMDVEKGTAITGVGADGNQVAGLAYEDTAAGATSITIQYETSDRQKNYVNCQVGASTRPNTDGCLAASGFVTIDGRASFGVGYTYDPVDNNVAKRTIQGLSTSARVKMHECNNCPYAMYQHYYNYYGQFDYANLIVLAAFAGVKTPFNYFNNDFGIYGYEGREQIIKKGTAYIIIWMYVIRQLEDALDNCQEACIVENCNDDPVHSWDKAAAYYVGSLEGEDGSGSGKLAYALADKLCANFKTCGESMDETAGSSHVNIEIMKSLGTGQAKLATGRCASARAEAERIQKLMLVPLIQGTLRFAYKTDFEPYSEKAEAEGVVFALAVVPAISGCDIQAANTIAGNMQAGQMGTADFRAVKEAFESTYDCLGIDGAMVGGLYDASTGSYFEGAEPIGVSAGVIWQPGDDIFDGFFDYEYYFDELNLQMSSTLSWGDKEWWNAEMTGLLAFNNMDASFSLNGNVDEGVSGRSLDLDLSFDDYEEEWDETKNEDTQRQLLQMSLAKDTQDYISMGLEIFYTDHIEANFRTGSEWSGNRLWDLASAVDFRWGSFSYADGYGDKISVGTELTESTSDFDLAMAGALTLQYGNDGTDTTTFLTEIVHDSSDKATMQLLWIYGEDDLFVVEAGSTCVWDGEDRWASDLSATVNADDDGGGDLAARVTDSVYDFAMDADFKLSFEEDDDVFSVAITGTSDGVREGEEIFDAELAFTIDGFLRGATGIIVAISIGESIADFNTDAKLEIADDIDNDAFVLRLATLQVLLGQETYADSTGEFQLVFDDSRAFVRLEDDGKMDFVAEMISSWGTETDDANTETFVFRFDKMSILRNTNIYLDGTGSLKLNDWFLSAKSNLHMPMASRHLDTDMLYDVYDLFILQSHVHYWSEDENYVDLRSTIAHRDNYNDLDDDFDDRWYESLELSCLDQGNLDFAMNFTGAFSEFYYNDDSAMYGTEVERMLLYSKETTFVDMMMSVKEIWEANTYDDYRYEILSETKEESDLQMDMKMSLEVDDCETFKMVMDHMVCGWRETSYLEMPMRLMTVAPVPIDNDAEPEFMTVSGISIRLEGMPALTDSTRLAFEKATEEFYHKLYASSETTGRRLSSEFLFRSFETGVTVTGDEPDEDGNTITYKQSIAFVSSKSTSDVSERDIQEVLASPLEVDVMKEKYLTYLVSSDTEFSQVSEVFAPVVPLSENADRRSKKLGARAVAGIVFACIVSCCFCGYFGIYFFLRFRQNRAAKFFADDFHAANPEEPIVEETPAENKKDDDDKNNAESSGADDEVSSDGESSDGESSDGESSDSSDEGSSDEESPDEESSGDSGSKESSYKDEYEDEEDEDKDSEEDDEDEDSQKDDLDKMAKSIV